LAEGLNLLEQVYGIRPTGIIHVGANNGQEVPSFRASGARPVLLFEPLAEPFANLERACAGAEEFYPIRACLADVADRTVPFHVASNGGKSSSYLPPAEHVAIAPNVTFDRVETMTTETLDRAVAKLVRERGIDPARLDYIGLDTQGSEMDILRGGQETLARAKCVYTEVNFGNLYRGDTGLYDAIALMRGWGFDLYHLAMAGRGWGDALFLRRGAVAEAAAARRRTARQAVQESRA
jgi:FkbM family methyltransferase